MTTPTCHQVATTYILTHSGSDPLLIVVAHVEVWPSVPNRVQVVTNVFGNSFGRAVLLQCGYQAEVARQMRHISYTIFINLSIMSNQILV